MLGRKYQPMKIDMLKDKNTGRYRLGLNSVFPITLLFKITKWKNILMW